MADQPPPHPRQRPARPSAPPAADTHGVDPNELIRTRDEHRTYMEQIKKEDNAPPGAFVLGDHLLRVLDRALSGKSDPHEVEQLLEASEQIDRWRQNKGYKLSPSSEALRNHIVDVLRRLAATQEEPSHTADPAELVARSIEPMTMCVDAFAEAIGKSPRTVYRMASNGELFVYRAGVGRGTVLIYRDQVDPANRPRLSATAKRPPLASPGNLCVFPDPESSEK